MPENNPPSPKRKPLFIALDNSSGSIALLKSDIDKPIKNHFLLSYK